VILVSIRKVAYWPTGATTATTAATTTAATATAAAATAATGTTLTGIRVACGAISLPFASTPNFFSYNTITSNHTTSTGWISRWIFAHIAIEICIWAFKQLVTEFMAGWIWMLEFYLTPCAANTSFNTMRG
jgi:hypothetical protein